MSGRLLVVAVLCAFAAIAVPGTARSADSKAPAPKRVVVSGIYVDRKDNKGDILTFLTDGEEEIKTYTLEGADKSVFAAMQKIFPNCRIRIAYKEDGDVRHIVAVEKIATRPTGIFVGEVIFVKNNFWIAVKPKNGPPDAFALGFDSNKGGPLVELLKSLQKGDIIAVKYNTDFERHRIVQLEKKEK
jgi:hypothetical protein